MKKILLALIAGVFLGGLISFGAPIKSGLSPESAYIIKEHHSGGPVAGVNVMPGGGMPPGGHMHGPIGHRPPMVPPPPPPRYYHHPRVITQVYYTSPYYGAPYGYYYPQNYVYSVRPVVKYRVPNVGYTFMY